MDIENCRHLLMDLSDYLDGDLTEEICQEIESHMDSCVDCQVVIDTLKKSVFLYRQLPQPEFPEQARVRLYEALDLSDLLNGPA